MSRGNPETIAGADWRFSAVETRVVASGNFYVGRTSRCVAEAYLGSCVGVSLCDRKAGVGGLIHLLLSEPVSREDGELFPAKYASVGLPVFVEALEKSGASAERLVAQVAGGALVGEVSDVDLFLDIGGRTVAVVERFLHQRGIEVEQLETGGYFTCRMALDMNCWETRVEPLSSRYGESVERGVKVPVIDVEKVACGLMPIPQVALKILRMIDDQDYAFAEIADEVRCDQTISAKLINLCNSSFFGRGQRVESLERALTILGERNLVKFVVSTFVEQLYRIDTQGYSLCKGGLYRHAVGTARLAEKLASSCGHVAPDLAYTGGLLHDIGKVGLDQFVAVGSPLFYRQVLDGERSLVEVEREYLGEDHASFGYKLADLWQFPASLKEAIGYHHHPQAQVTNMKLVRLVFLADLIMSRFKVGKELERMNCDNLPQCLEQLGMDPRRLNEMVASLPAELPPF